MKVLRSAISGTLVDVLYEIDEHYWVTHKNRAQSDPFTVPKNSKSWEEVAVEPEVGDVWGNVEGGVGYRVLGIDKKRGIWHLTPAGMFYDGEYPSPGDEGQPDRDSIQVYPAANGLVVYTRVFPDPSIDHWTLKERP